MMFDVSILWRLGRLDVLNRDVALLRPFHELSTDVFRAIVDSHALRFAIPFVDLVQASDDPLGRQRVVEINGQTFV